LAEFSHDELLVPVHVVVHPEVPPVVVVTLAGAEYQGVEL
jgi:hypothetical protein